MPATLCRRSSPRSACESMPCANAVHVAARHCFRDRGRHAGNVGRPHKRYVVERRQHVAHVAVGHRGQDRPLRSEILVGLVGNEAGAFTHREVMHGQEEQVGGTQQGDRLVV